jgi:hypothetical protein
VEPDGARFQLASDWKPVTAKEESAIFMMTGTNSGIGGLRQTAERLWRVGLMIGAVVNYQPLKGLALMARAGSLRV